MRPHGASRALWAEPSGATRTRRALPGGAGRSSRTPPNRGLAPRAGGARATSLDDRQARSGTGDFPGGAARGGRLGRAAIPARRRPAPRPLPAEAPWSFLAYLLCWLPSRGVSANVGYEALGFSRGIYEDRLPHETLYHVRQFYPSSASSGHQLCDQTTARQRRALLRQHPSRLSLRPFERVQRRMPRGRASCAAAAPRPRNPRLELSPGRRGQLDVCGRNPLHERAIWASLRALERAAMHDASERRAMRGRRR
jgi:hypothetical protein